MPSVGKKASVISLNIDTVCLHEFKLLSAKKENDTHLADVVTSPLENALATAFM